MSEVRLDILLHQQKYFSSREKSKRAIRTGKVSLAGRVLLKPAEKFDETATFDILRDEIEYVSRGGKKLERAINEFDINLTGKIMLDIGSSTGGFTDCGLKNGISLSYALDVGTDQLVDKLRNDHRVVVMEQTNFKTTTKNDFNSGLPTFVSIDVSFISLTTIFDNLINVIEEGTCIVALIKPQFEIGQKVVSKSKGIVKRKEDHVNVINKIIRHVEFLGFNPLGLTYSPITGAKGNIEFLLYTTFKTNDKVHIDVVNVVNKAHKSLK